MRDFTSKPTLHKRIDSTTTVCYTLVNQRGGHSSGYGKKGGCSGVMGFLGFVLCNIRCTREGKRKKPITNTKKKENIYNLICMAIKKEVLRIGASGLHRKEKR